MARGARKHADHDPPLSRRPRADAVAACAAVSAPRLLPSRLEDGARFHYVKPEQSFGCGGGHLDVGGDLTVDNGLGVNSQFQTARVRLLNASDVEIYDSGVVALTNGDLSLDVIPDTALTRKVVFEGLTWGSNVPCIGEIDVFGTQP